MSALSSANARTSALRTFALSKGVKTACSLLVGARSCASTTAESAPSAVIVKVIDPPVNWPLVIVLTSGPSVVSGNSNSWRSFNGPTRVIWR